MLESRKTALVLDEKDLLDLERVVVGADDKDALIFLQKKIYDKVVAIQRRN